MNATHIGFELDVRQDFLDANKYLKVLRIDQVPAGGLNLLPPEQLTVAYGCAGLLACALCKDSAVSWVGAEG